VAAALWSKRQYPEIRPTRKLLCFSICTAFATLSFDIIITKTLYRNQWRELAIKEEEMESKKMMLSREIQDYIDKMREEGYSSDMSEQEDNG